MAVATIEIAATYPDGSAFANAPVKVEHTTGTFVPGHAGTFEILGVVELTTDAGGLLDFDVELCVDDLEGTLYRVRCGGKEWRIQPITAGTYAIGDPTIDASGIAPGIQYQAGPPGEVTTAAMETYVDSGIDGLDELANGYGTTLDTATAGFVGVDRTAHWIHPKSTATASTAAETSLLLATIDFPADTFGQFDEEVFGSCWISIVNNTGSNRDVTIRVKLDTTTVYTVTLTGIGTSATARVLGLRWSWIFGDLLGSAVSFGGCEYTLSAAASGGGAAALHGVATAGGSHTLSNELSFDVTTQMSTSSSSLTTQMLFGTVGVRRLIDG